MTIRPRIRLLVACAAAVNFGLIAALGIALLSTGSGASGSSSVSGLARLTAIEAQSPTDLISGDEVSAAGRGPAATLLQWWQAIQFGLPVSQVASYYAPGAEVIGAIAAELRLVRYYVLANRPVVVDVRTNGSTARVFALVAHGGLGASNPSTGGTPIIFDLVRAGNRWMLADDGFLARRALAELTFRNAHRRR